MTRRTSRKPRRVRRTSLRRSSKYETPLELILRGWRPRVTSADVRKSKRLRPNATVGQLFAERLSAAAEYPDLSVSDAAHRLAYGFRGGLSGMIERLRHDPNGWSYWREGDALGLKKYKHDKVRKDVQTATRQSLDAWDALADKLLPNTSHDEYKRLHYEYAQAGQQVTRSEASLRKARELELRDPDFDLLYRRSARVAGELFSGRERLAAAKDAMRVAVGGPKRLTSRRLRPNSARSGWSKKFKIVGVETLRSGTYKVYADVDQDDHFSVIVYPAGPMQVLSERHGKLLEDDLTEKQRKQVHDAVKLRPNAPAVIEKAVKAGRLYRGSLGCRISDQQKLYKAWHRALAAVERAYPNTDAADQVTARVEQLGSLTPMPGKDI